MKKIMIIAAAVAAMAACTKSTVVYEDSTEIGISPVNYVTTKLNYGPIKNDKYPTTEDFGVFAQHTTADAGEDFATGTGTLNPYLVNVGFTHKDNGQWGGITTYYWPKTGSLYFAGYSPFGADVTDVAYDFNRTTPGITITNFTQGNYAYTNGVGENPTGYEMVDLMWFEATPVSANTGAPNVIFMHALSYLTFAFSANVDNLFTIESVTLKQVNRTGSFKSASLEWDAYANPQDISLYNTTQALSNTDFTIDNVLVIPQETAEIEIVYTQKAAADQPAITQTYSAKLTGGETGALSSSWLYNRHYTYKISFSGEEIRLTPTIVPWLDANMNEIPVE